MGSDFELKIIPTRDDNDPSSTFELQLAKATARPFFWSDEANSMFILTAKLTGFAREDIVITINGSGTRIEIDWGSPVRKVKITGSTYKEEMETRRFKKIFRIPDGVVLDEIKATYNDEELILKILMPKSAYGIFGVGIEEVKELEADGATTFESQDNEELETLETSRKTNLVEDNQGNEEDDAVHGEVEGENAEPEALPKIENAAETLPEEIKKLKGNETEDTHGDSKDYSKREQSDTVAIKSTEYEATGENGEIKFTPKARSMKGKEVAEGTSQGTANHQKGLNAEARNADIATMINKKPDVKTQSQASIDRELPQPNRPTQAEPLKQEAYKNVRESKKLETNKEPEDIGNPHLQSPPHHHEEKGVDQKGKSFQSEDEIKETKEECKSTHEDSNKEAQQEKKQDSKEFKMRTPFIIAGSALLASLVIVVFNLVKSKREKNTRG